MCVPNPPFSLLPSPSSPTKTCQVPHLRLRSHAISCICRPTPLRSRRIFSLEFCRLPSASSHSDSILTSQFDSSTFSLFPHFSFQFLYFRFSVSVQLPLTRRKSLRIATTLRTLIIASIPLPQCSQPITTLTSMFPRRPGSFRARLAALAARTTFTACRRRCKKTPTRPRSFFFPAAVRATVPREFRCPAKSTSACLGGIRAGRTLARKSRSPFHGPHLKKNLRAL